MENGMRTSKVEDRIRMFSGSLVFLPSTTLLKALWSVTKAEMEISCGRLPVVVSPKVHGKG
jgi:hypothetical protein